MKLELELPGLGRLSGLGDGAAPAVPLSRDSENATGNTPASDVGVEPGASLSADGVTAGERGNVGHSDSVAAALRPVVVVQVTPIPEPGRLSLKLPPPMAAASQPSGLSWPFELRSRWCQGLPTLVVVALPVAASVATATGMVRNDAVAFPAKPLTFAPIPTVPPSLGPRR